MKICIDPGHGGWDPGALGKIDGTLVKESKIVLSASLMLGGILVGMGHETIFTRVSDRYPRLFTRKYIANRNNVDLFVSIHCDAFESSRPGGFCSYFLSGAKEARVVSRKLASKMDFNDFPLHGNGIKRAQFYVLRKTKMPAVLCELGFITNDEDLLRLTNHESLSWEIQLIAETIDELGWHQNAPE